MHREGGTSLKNGKKLTKDEKQLLADEGYNYKDFLRVKRTSEFYLFINVRTEKTLTIHR